MPNAESHICCVEQVFSEERKRLVCKVNLSESDRLKLRDCWHGYEDERITDFERVQSDLDYLRGFAQGMAFLFRFSEQNGKDWFQRFDEVWEEICAARFEIKEGRTCVPFMDYMRNRFKIRFGCRIEEADLML